MSDSDSEPLTNTRTSRRRSQQKNNCTRITFEASSPCIMCVQYHEGVQYRGGYLKYHIMGVLSTVRDILRAMASVKTLSTVGGGGGINLLLFQYLHGTHEFPTVLSTPHGTHDIPLRY